MFRLRRPSRAPLIALVLVVATGTVGARAEPAVDAMRSALRYVAQQDWQGAEQAARGGGRLALDIVTWTRLRTGKGDFPEYLSFLQRHPDWPGLGILQLRGEQAITDQTPAGLGLSYFDGRHPLSAGGSLAYQRALEIRGERSKAAAEARRAWLNLSYSARDQARELQLFGGSLRPLVPQRMDMLLWQGRLADARQLLPLVSGGEAALARARIALQAQERGVDALVAAVPGRWRNDPGLAYDRFAFRYDRGLYKGAVEMLLAHSGSASALGRPEAWAFRRAALARREMDDGNPRLAYRIASSAHLRSGVSFATLEFLSGYIALHKLNDPKLALKHFRALRAAVKTPISLSRAAYWEGRAEEALGNYQAASTAFAYGAEFPTAFYGQLSAEKMGIKIDASLLGPTRLPDWHGARFMASSPLRAGLLLLRADDTRRARLFFYRVAMGLDLTGLGQLANLALDLRAPGIAVLVAKRAAEMGRILPGAYFPTGDLTRLKLPVPTVLALAIARRESEFDAGAISPAGARGLMQMMPATARKMSAKAGLPYTLARLTEDPAYNARLGSAYLAELTARFGPALTLVAAGYNAGPNRAAIWISKLGDPRAPGVDPIDWIEAVPYTETRNYIMRVAETYEIYRAKLAGHPVNVRLTAELKGR